MMIDEYKLILRQARSEAKKLKQEMELLDRKRRMRILDQFHLAHEEIFGEIDCTLCANCCREVGPRLLEPDIQRLAKLFKMKRTVFIGKYLKKDDDDDWVFKEMPCPFLEENNLCQVYENRPRACRDYPHTHDRDIHKRLKRLAVDATYCPGAYKIAKKVFKDTLGN